MAVLEQACRNVVQKRGIGPSTPPTFDCGCSGCAAQKCNYAGTVASVKAEYRRLLKLKKAKKKWKP